MNIWQIIKRELKQVFRLDVRRAIFLFGAALAYLILFGILYSPHIVKDVPFVIYDEDQTHISRTLVHRFVDSESYQVVKFVSSQEEVQQALKDKTAYGAVQIPKDFSKNVSTGSDAVVLVTINGSNIIITNTVSTAAQDILAVFSDDLAAKKAAMAIGLNQESAQRKVTPVSCHLRVLNNQTQSYLLFFVLALGMAAFQQGIFLAVGAAVHYEYNHAASFRNGGIRKLLAGKLITYWILSMISFALIVLAAEWILRIYDKAPYGPLFLLAGAFSFTAIALSMMAASLFRTELQFVRASIMYTVPAFIMAGASFPLESMSSAMVFLGRLFPMSWLTNSVRSLILSGTAPEWNEDMVALLAMGLVCLAIGSYAFIHTMSKRLCSSK